MNGKKAKKLRRDLLGKTNRLDIYSTMKNGQVVNVARYKYQKAKKAK